MRQILQNLGSGEMLLADVPCPQVKRGFVQIQSQTSLISLGTERMLVSFGRAGYLEKARQQPEKVKQVISKIKTNGLASTISAVQRRLDSPLALGYCNAGVVLEVGEGVTEFSPGDRVVSNGSHAEVVCVPKNLCALIPDGVPFDEACYTVAGSISLQGVRLLKPTLGERIVVTGLGLIGLLASQILRAHGCLVLGVDPDKEKCALAERLGITTFCPSGESNAVTAAERFSEGKGVDGVLITASTPSSDPVNQAAEMCRKRGRIIQVGNTGLHLLRDALYKKELSIQVSCSYGPGRYEPAYEAGGFDYPMAYVRWTEQRNFEAVLGLLKSGSLDVRSLTTHRFKFDDALEAYSQVMDGDALGIVLEYPKASESNKDTLKSRTVALSGPSGDSMPASRKCGVAVIGAGLFSSGSILPHLKTSGAELVTIASSKGVSGTHNGKKFGFSKSTTDVDAIFNEERIDLVVVATQHNTHARFSLQALRAKKAVYVEKPLCLSRRELAEIAETYRDCEGGYLMVGFNRRFAPHVVKMKSLLSGRQEPLAVNILINAGVLPRDHWHHDPEVGGGRMIAEGCHFIDLARHIVGSRIVGVEAVQFGSEGEQVVNNDKVSILLRFADGSIATIQYLGNGSKDFPKERVEVFCEGKVLQLENFRVLRGYGWKSFKKMKLFRMDKGHGAELHEVVNSVKSGKPAPIPFDEILEVMEATFTVVERAAEGTEFPAKAESLAL